MQGTSANYAPYVDEIRTDALIEFELIDVDAAKVAGATATEPAAEFTKLQQVHDNITQNSMKLATFERDLWALDGSFSLPNRVDNLETGYFSGILSDQNGGINATIFFEFNEPQSSDGFTVIFDTKTEEVAEVFNVIVYKGRITTEDRKEHEGAPYDSRWVVDGVNVSYVFDPIWYADHNGDLYNAFGHDVEQLWNHYLNNGIHEGRTAYSNFEPWQYRANNPDLLSLDSYTQSGSLSLKNYVLHYVQTGRHELFPYDSKRISGNSNVISYVGLKAKDYKRVSITFEKTAKPYRRVRLTEFVFGRVQQFKGRQIKDMRVTYESGVYMENMPASSLRFTIDNSDRGYNVLNPTGIYAFLQEGQGVNASISINGESVNMGRFYFAEAAANDDALTATVVAYDLLWRLDNTTCTIGTTGTWTLAEAVAAVVANSGVEMPINIPAEIGARVIGKAIPSKASHREALRMIAQAGRTVLYFNRIGELKAKDYTWNEAVDAVTGRNMRSWGDAKDTGLINRVVLTAENEYTKTKVEYIADDRQPGEPLQVLEVANPLATQDTANWILQCKKHRNQYNVPVQANPARDIGDCISIANVYGYSDNAVITKQETAYTGAVIDTIIAFGGGV